MIFLDQLRLYNEHTNLVSNADPAIVVRDHVLDSLSLVPIIRKFGGNEKQMALVDIGSGAGFPAIVLAIAIDDLQVLLIDSVGKKTRFLKEAAQALGLQDRVDVVTARAEELPRDESFRESFNFATARAVGKLDLVCELTLPFLRRNGYLLAQKSKAQADEELKAATHAISKLGGEVVSTEVLNRDVLQKDFVVTCIRKVNPTPAMFPRPTAQLKQPIK